MCMMEKNTHMLYIPPHAMCAFTAQGPHTRFCFAATGVWLLWPFFGLPTQHHIERLLYLFAVSAPARRRGERQRKQTSREQAVGK